MRTGRSASTRIFGDDHVFTIGKGQIIHPGNDLTIIACGVTVARAMEAAQMLAKKNIAARVVNMPTIKPIDRTLLSRCAAETGAFVTAEDHNILGGLGGAVAEATAELHPVAIEFVGLKDRFGESGEPAELAEHLGIGATAIAAAAERVLKRKKT
jgi:transketolase